MFHIGSKKEQLIFDVDGVLLLWISGVIKFLASKGLSTSHIDGTGNSFFTLEYIFAQDSFEKNMALYNEFKSSKYMGELEPYCKSVKRIVEDLAREYELSIVTCIGTDRGVVALREKNIQDCFGGAFETIICLDKTAPKLNALKFLSETGGKVAGFIDDKGMHVHEGISAGLPSFQFIDGSPEHRILSSVEHLKNWGHIEDKFILSRF
ncbi:hypothetical protein LMH73_007345 [Vibrio splendidus]|nr:hypothetical protein [Vibrio splendidus]MCC4883132.1 hypothetical protein [Vibrio splendidus]